MLSSFTAQNVAEGIGTQSVKVQLVRMCLCLVDTHMSLDISYVSFIQYVESRVHGDNTKCGYFQLDVDHRPSRP